MSNYQKRTKRLSQKKKLAAKALENYLWEHQDLREMQHDARLPCQEPRELDFDEVHMAVETFLEAMRIHGNDLHGSMHSMRELLSLWIASDAATRGVINWTVGMLCGHSLSWIARRERVQGEYLHPWDAEISVKKGARFGLELNPFEAFGLREDSWSWYESWPWRIGSLEDDGVDPWLGAYA
jgi:hypothetical protein